MAKQWITVAALIFGGAAFAVALHVQSSSRAFTSSAARATIEADARRASVRPGRLTVSVPEPPADPPIIQVPAVHITSAPTAPRELAPADGEDVKPCSPWCEIGPTHVDDGVGTGVRRVRELC